MINFLEILKEDKSHLIKRLNLNNPDLEQKYINHINKYNPRIDWNLSKEKIIDQIENSIMSKKSQELEKEGKKELKSGNILIPWKNREENDFHLWYSNEEYVFISPLSFKCAEYIDTIYNVPYCITKSFTLWKRYICKDKNSFVFFYKKDGFFSMLMRKSNGKWDIVDQKNDHVPQMNLTKLFENLNLKLPFEIDKKLKIEFNTKLIEKFNIITKDIKEEEKAHKEELIKKLPEFFLGKFCISYTEDDGGGFHGPAEFIYWCYNNKIISIYLESLLDMENPISNISKEEFKEIIEKFENTDEDEVEMSYNIKKKSTIIKYLIDDYKFNEENNKHLIIRYEKYVKNLLIMLGLTSEEANLKLNKLQENKIRLFKEILNKAISYEQHLDYYNYTNNFDKMNPYSIRPKSSRFRKKSELFSSLKENKSKTLIGTCKEVGKNTDLPWENATELAQDLGYYSTFDEFDGDPEDSNWMTISSHDFAENCIYNLPKHHFEFLRRKNSPHIYCVYDKDTDTHHFYN